MRIVSRSEWGARPPKARHTISLPTPRCWVHHTATEQHGAAGMRAIQAFHMDVKGWLDIAYSFVIDDDGTVYEARGAGVAGGHTAGDNSTSHAICLMGNFETRPPQARALDSLVELARHGRDRGWWVPTLGGHRDAPGASTACPGRFLYAQLPDIRSRVAGNVSQPEEDPMPSFDDIRRASQLGTGDALSDPDHRAYQAVADAAQEGAKRALNAALGSPTTPVARKLLAVLSAADIDADVDPAALAEALAEALPAEQAKAFADEVADELAERLSG